MDNMILKTPTDRIFSKDIVKELFLGAQCIMVQDLWKISPQHLCTILKFSDDQLYTVLSKMDEMSLDSDLSFKENMAEYWRVAEQTRKDDRFKAGLENAIQKDPSNRINNLNSTKNPSNISNPAVDNDLTKLKGLISEYGKIWENYKMSKALFMDVFNDNKVLWHSLLACVEESIPEEISRIDTCSQTDYYRFVKRIKGTIGCSDEVANRAVSLWVSAISIGVDLDNAEKQRDSHEIKSQDDIPIEEIELTVREFNALKRAGINTIGDIYKKSPDDYMGVRNLGRKSYEEVLAKLKKLGLSMNSENNIEAENKHPGKDKCDRLREIRKKIAEANGIDFIPTECHHTGPCPGTCPVCDEEIKYIDDELQKKRARGEEIVLNGIAANDIKESGCDIEPDHYEDIIEMGMALPPDLKGNKHNGKTNDSDDEITMGIVNPDDFSDGDIW